MYYVYVYSGPRLKAPFGEGFFLLKCLFKKKKSVFFSYRCIVTVRDFLSWVQFINVCSSTNSTDQHTLLEPSQAYFHGAFLVFLDALGLGRMVNSQSTNSAREFLLNQVKGFDDHDNATIKAMETENYNNDMFTFGGFSIARGRSSGPSAKCWGGGGGGDNHRQPKS